MMHTVEFVRQSDRAGYDPLEQFVVQSRSIVVEFQTTSVACKRSLVMKWT